MHLVRGIEVHRNRLRHRGEAPLARLLPEQPDRQPPGLGRGGRRSLGIHGQRRFLIAFDNGSEATDGFVGFAGFFGLVGLVGFERFEGINGPDGNNGANGPGGFVGFFGFVGFEGLAGLPPVLPPPLRSPV